MNITRWSIPKSDWLYSLQSKMEKLCTISKNKTGSGLWIRSWTPYAKFRLKLRKVGKTTRPFRCDLNQIPYDYTVEVTNRFKGLDLIDGGAWRTVDGVFLTLYRRQGSRPSPRKRNAKRQSGCLRKPYNSWEKKRNERQRRKGKIHPFECRVPKNSKERLESLLQWPV